MRFCNAISHTSYLMQLPSCGMLSSICKGTMTMRLSKFLDQTFSWEPNIRPVIRKPKKKDLQWKCFHLDFSRLSHTSHAIFKSFLVPDFLKQHNSLAPIASHREHRPKSAAHTRHNSKQASTKTDPCPAALSASRGQINSRQQRSCLVQDPIQ